MLRKTKNIVLNAFGFEKYSKRMLNFKNLKKNLKTGENTIKHEKCPEKQLKFENERKKL